MEVLRAFEAQKLLEPALGAVPARQLLIQRARAGLVSTTARVLNKWPEGREEREHHAQLPRAFWIMGESASQDWILGDFSNWIPVSVTHTCSWEAYDVGFERTAVEALGQHLDGYLLLDKAIEALSRGDLEWRLESIPIQGETRSGRPPDAEKWGNFAAAMLAFGHLEGPSDNSSLSELYNQVADYAAARGRQVPAKSNCQASLSRALQWVRGVDDPISG